MKDRLEIQGLLEAIRGLAKEKKLTLAERTEFEDYALSSTYDDEWDDVEGLFEEWRLGSQT